ncbi:n-acetylglutamate synthase [Fibrella sp. HMF5335]|uniref:N-acetylglutamate synthase n=1 Tax=Fibrella rubiginis TaxID=2817060 RepID=A0A939K2A1_9BACT|nr:n-acetylglutamate synthase [Fibrella rubiginis]MBO0936099.1 n-acetylglutamate synthase [Fibrella rubiginis]
MDYDGKLFRIVSNTDNGETSSATFFRYHQDGDRLIGSYCGGVIVDGSLAGTVDDAGVLTFQYQHVNTDGETRTGTCRSVPETLPTGKIRLHETWQWTSGDGSAGASVIEEV